MKNTKKIIALTIFVFAIYACQQTTTQTTQQQTIDTLRFSKGFQLLEGNCFACHSPNAQIENIAPSAANIKKAYINADTLEANFVAAITNFVKDPNKDKSKMPQAIEKYGLMPKFSFNDQQLNDIAYYLYHSNIEANDWFTKNYEQEKNKHLANGTLNVSYEDLGLSLAMTTKSVLGKNLMGAIKQKGPEHAVSFCNERALHLTDSMSAVLKATIKRVSDQPRNPTRQANETEIAYIKQAKQQLANGEKITPKVQEIEGKMVGYYPITIDQMCLQCHGNTQTDIKPATLKIINKLYPTDKARNYKLNDLRGIWVVAMDKR